MPKSTAMSPVMFARILVAALLLAPFVAVSSATSAGAQTLRWPSSTHQREQKPAWVGKPRWTDQSAPQAEQQPSAPATAATTAGTAPRTTQTASESKPASTSSACKAGETCVKCVANCAEKAPTTVQKLDAEQVAAAKPTSGPTEPSVGTGRWNAIRCYEGGGCTATGVSAPRRIERSSDGYVTYWRLW